MLHLLHSLRNLQGLLLVICLCNFLLGEEWEWNKQRLLEYYFLLFPEQIKSMVWDINTKESFSKVKATFSVLPHAGQRYLSLLYCYALLYKLINSTVTKYFLRHIKDFPLRIRGKQISCCSLELANWEKIFETKNILKFMKPVRI